jgi:cytoskeletal protein RodZ
MTQTRVYSGFGSSIEEEKAPEEEAQQPQEQPVKVRRRRSFNVHIADSRKFKRLIVLAVAFFVLLAFEISFAVMKAQTASLPDRTAEFKSQTEALQTDNEALRKSADEIGEYDQVKELRDSWQRIKDKLAE